MPITAGDYNADLIDAQDSYIIVSTTHHSIKTFFSVATQNENFFMRDVSNAHIKTYHQLIIEVYEFAFFVYVCFGVVITVKCH